MDWYKKMHEFIVVYSSNPCKKSMTNNDTSDAFQFTYAKYYGFLKDLDGDLSDQTLYNVKGMINFRKCRVMAVFNNMLTSQLII